MSAFLEAVQTFVDDTQNEKAGLQELHESSRKLHKCLDTASDTDITEALHRFETLLVTGVPLGALGLVALHCGILVERGGDPEIVGSRLVERLPVILKNSGEYYRRVRALALADEALIEELRNESDVEGEEDEEEPEHESDVGQDEEEGAPEEILEEHIANHGWGRLDERFWQAVSKEQPAAVFGQMAEEFFRRGLTAHLERSKAVRLSARSNPELLAQTLEVDGLAGTQPSSLAIMLQVLDNEPLIVLHVAQKKGYEVRISGIADNFQLHTLLAGALIGSPAKGWLKGKAPSKLAIAQCRDAPLCDGGEDVTGPFNLFHWTALGQDGSLSSRGEGMEVTQHWIWNEGSPADITPFEDRRVILLGPSPYARFWQAGRTFYEMVGELTVERTLKQEEVESWLMRLQEAVRE